MLRLALALTVGLTSPLRAELPRAFTVSPQAVAPGEITTLTVNGQFLAGATELWTDLDAEIEGFRPIVEPKLTSSFEADVSRVEGTLTVEAEDFVRGKFRKNGPVIINGGFKPNYAEWDFDLPSPGHFILEFKFASGQSRPVKLFLNGRLLRDKAAVATTGGFANSDAKWVPECVVALRKGINTIRVECSGGTPHFDRVALVPTDLPASQFAVVTPSDRNAPFEVRIPAATPVGIHGLRVATPEGLSNLVLYMVDDLPLLEELPGRGAGRPVQELALPVAVEGQCDSGSVDRFRFHANAGERITIEVVATRLGSRLDPVMRLFDSGGRELLYVDDSPGLAGDCAVRYRFEQAGDYTVSLEDSAQGGASLHRYRLRIGDFPLIASSLPASVSPGVETEVRFAGPDAQLLPAVSVQATGAGAIPVSVSFPGKIGSGFTQVSVRSIKPVVLSAASVETIAIPVALNGVLREAGEHHRCRFQGKKGDRLVVRDSGRSQGRAVTAVLTILDAQGKRLIERRQAGTAGQELQWTVPADGEYLLQIADLTSRGGPEFVYSVDVLRGSADFRLSLEQDSVILPQNGYALLQVKAERRGYQGDIALTVEGFGADVRLAGDIIPKGKQATRLKVYLPAGRILGQTDRLRVVGVGWIDGRDVRRTASTRTSMRASQPQTSFPPRNLDGLIASSVAPEIPDFFGLSLDGNAVMFPRFIGEVYFTVRVKDRAKGFGIPVNIRVEGLPRGYSAGGGENPVGGSQNSEYRFQLSGPRGAVELREHKLRIIGEATFKGQTKEVELVDVPLRVVEPLLVRVDLSGPLTAGSRQTARVVARRFVRRSGGDKKPIEVRFADVPEGVRVPDRFVIAAGKNTIDVMIAVDQDVDIRSVRPLRVIATTTVAERETIATTMIPFGVDDSTR